ncbi:MAG: DoxX family membrane protein [Candidatus Omnitrophica bacterium]|nr:DoxX family membrane protein [Candidatus Omnitrophota bacterium]
MFVVIRCVLGLLFVISGGEKLLSPTENFLYVIDSYQMLPRPLEQAVAVVFPWLEVMTGVFILSGLWLRQALATLLLISASLMVIVGQAIVRKLPLDNCGCFGELIHLPLRGVILVDLSVFVLALLCLFNIRKTARFSLDGFYAGQEKV